MVTDWTGEREVAITSPAGRFTIRADAVVLATGARERPRPARRIPGDRPDGVLTTGQLQNLVHHLHHRRLGTAAVVVGGELVSWSAVLTLREAGCRTVAMVTSYPRAEAYAAVRWAGRTALRVPVLGHSDVVRIDGRERVRSVVVRDRLSGAERVVPCDTVVTTGDWIPDHELARSGGLDQCRGLAGAGAGKHQQRAGLVVDDPSLVVVELDRPGGHGGRGHETVRRVLRHGVSQSSAADVRSGAAWVRPDGW
jgi:NADPH-dependent 2,4-dienoyl-CoA reductase/sulfur reductase-like enzyme